MRKNKCKSCDMCVNCLPIGEGDHICEEEIGKFVLEDYAPTDDYFWCGGKYFVER